MRILDRTGSEAGTRPDRAAFEADGFAIIDPGIPDAELDATVAEIAGEFREESRAERLARRAKRAIRGRDSTLSARHGVRIQDAWTISDGVKRIATAPAVIEALRALYDREPLPFQTINFRFGSQQHAHSDAMHFNSDPPGLMCGVWVALEDVDEDNGPLVYYPGSQRWRELTLEDVAEATGKADGAAYSDYEELLRSAIRDEGMEMRQANLRKGQALVWSSNLIHGGAIQRDPGRTRWSQVTHYFFSGCRAYWKPIDSAPGGRRHFEPAWVR